MSDTAKRATVTRADGLKRVEKAWGRELWLQADGGAAVGYCGKLLRIEAGASGSLHYHPRKHETMLVAQGRIRVELIAPNSNELAVYELTDGDVIELPNGVAHRITAIGGPATVFEVSTPHDDADVVRIEESRGPKGTF